MGGPGQCIEIGVISLGTSSQVNGKQVTLINISLGTSSQVNGKQVTLVWDLL